MRATEKAGNILRGLVQRFGTKKIKRHLWNREYRQGRWKCLENMPDDFVYAHVEKHAKNGDILDLGCGPGEVGSRLAVAAYRSYTGIDISFLAILKARQRVVETGRGGKAAFIQCDIRSYVPNAKYAVILFGDSIYYFSHRAVATLLARYSECLTPEGIFVVRTWTATKRARAIIRNIEQNFEVLEKCLYYESRIVVIAFKPRRARTI
jgi:SAM-dependent methyltransferase